jgi:hypothetical protein
MRPAPPLAVAVLPLWQAQSVVAVLTTLAAAGLAVRFAPWAALLLPLVFWLAWRQARVEERRLRWDGEQWWLQASIHQDEQAIRLQVVLDLDTWLLVRGRTAAGRGRWHYFPLNRAGQGSIWGALRATLMTARAT